MFLPAMLIPGCDSSSLVFCMMYSAYKLNKQGDIALMYSFPNLEPVHCSMSGSNYCFLTCTQVSQGTGKVVWYFHLFNNLPQFVVIRTVKGFGVVDKAEVDIFLELSCIFDDPVDVGNLISGSSAFSKSSLNIWKFSVHILLNPSGNGYLFTDSLKHFQILLCVRLCAQI